jgi:hypothetical protein
VVAPAQFGFGSRLIETSPAKDFGGTVEAHGTTRLGLFAW